VIGLGLGIPYIGTGLNSGIILKIGIKHNKCKQLRSADERGAYRVIDRVVTDL
jgi:hypothetical protein